MQDSQLDNHFNGKYKFDIKELTSRASQLSRENTFAIFTSLALMISLTILFCFVLFSVYGIESIEQLVTSEDSGLAISFLVYNIALAPMWGGIAMMALFSARGQKANTLMVFSFFSFLPQLGLVSVLVDTLAQLGLQMFFVPAFYVYMASTFIVPLIIDKKIHPFKAIVLSVKMTNAYLFPMALVYLIFLALMIAGFLSLFIGFIWIIPFIYNVKAILYQDLFCVESTISSEQEEPTDIFNA